jgi:predicted Fe-S protein YdhL (DUF1289 family)
MKMLAARAEAVRLADHNVPSPCVSVCTMALHSGLCTGCLRSLDEIATWSTCDDSQKKAIWVKIEQRIVAIATDLT